MTGFCPEKLGEYGNAGGEARFGGVGRVEIKFLLDALNLSCLLGAHVGEAMEGRQLRKCTSQEEGPGEQPDSSVASLDEDAEGRCGVSRGPRMGILWGHFHV